MRNIIKFAAASAQHENTFFMPHGAEIMHVDQEKGLLALWVLADASQPPQKRTFVVMLTGDAEPANSKHVGTFKQKQMCHVFEVVR